MTEKRFTVHIVWLNYDKTDGEITLKDNGQPLLECDCVEDVQMVKDLLNELHDENIELHIQNDFLKDENQHMRKLVNENKQLQERNNRQAKQLDNIYNLIEKEEWKTLKGIIQEFQECEEQLKKEWSDYE